MALLMEKRLTVHRMIICSDLVFKNPKSSFGTHPATAVQNGKQNRKKSEAPEDSWRL